MLRLYGYFDSGNGYKIRLLLHHLGIPLELIESDVVKGEIRTPEFFAHNPNGRIPTLELEDGGYLPESSAILYYLASGTPWLPDDRLERARVLQWMCFEQYNHEPNIANSRYWLKQLDIDAARQIQLDGKRPAGYAALDVMGGRLADRQWFVGDTPTIADIALYANTHEAGEGGFDLSGYPAIRAWPDRVSATPGYIAITQG
ncbi:MAG: glutathione S-transferase family protein [Alphaproteobacteria bacterium]